MHVCMCVLVFSFVAVWFGRWVLSSRPEIEPMPPTVGFPGGSVVKNPPPSAGDAGDSGSTPESGRFPGGGNGSPLQYSYLENSMDRGAWQATIHDVAKSQT